MIRDLKQFSKTRAYLAQPLSDQSWLHHHFQFSSIKTLEEYKLRVLKQLMVNESFYNARRFITLVNIFLNELKLQNGLSDDNANIPSP